MNREWKPGDVAMVNDCTRPDRPWEAATCIAARTPERETTWRLHRNGGEVWGSVSDARPLVVIDPEDREAVERLVEVFSGQPNWYADTRRQRSDAMQAALREFANPTPPKPEEPLGLGAVVEDESSGKWVRWSADHPEPWTAADYTDNFGDRAWSDFAAVTVLGEGVTS